MGISKNSIHAFGKVLLESEVPAALSSFLGAGHIDFQGGERCWRLSCSPVDSDSVNHACITESLSTPKRTECRELCVGSFLKIPRKSMQVSRTSNYVFDLKLMCERETDRHWWLATGLMVVLFFFFFFSFDQWEHGTLTIRLFESVFCANYEIWCHNFGW